MSFSVSRSGMAYTDAGYSGGTRWRTGPRSGADMAKPWRGRTQVLAILSLCQHVLDSQPELLLFFGGRLGEPERGGAESRCVVAEQLLNAECEIPQAAGPGAILVDDVHGPVGPVAYGRREVLERSLQ